MIKNIFKGVGAFAALCAYVTLYVSPFIFTALLIAKLIGFTTIPWFAWSEAAVITTPMYMFFGGMIGIGLSVFLIALTED